MTAPLNPTGPTDPANPADPPAGTPGCLVMLLGLVLFLGTGWGMLNVVGTGLHDRFMPAENPLSTLDVRDCLHVPEEDKDPLIVKCVGGNDKEAPHYTVRALVQSPDDCYRVPASEAVLTVEQRVACLGPHDQEKPRSAAGARVGLCRSDLHHILGWRPLCSSQDQEALLVFRTTDHDTDPRDQCLARGIAATDSAVATRLVDITTRPGDRAPGEPDRLRCPGEGVIAQPC